MTDRKLPRLAYNRVSILGAFMALVTMLIMTFLYVIDVFATDTNPYFGIFLYMVLPVFLVLGLVLIPLGMIRHWRRWKKTGLAEIPTWPILDLNNPSQRNATLIFFFGTLLFLGATAVGSYQAYHFSESVTFCGKVCHAVMKPEHTAYMHSPHARVACVSCHVGPGADWFAKSKLSGAYQVYAALANVYPRPIGTPIENLRPAQETCEQCHWPQKFFGAQQRRYDHFMYDSANTAWPIDMLIKVGGGDFRSGKVYDIHWHVNPEVQIEYIARDKKRQEIPWVKVTDKKTGAETVYQSDSPFTAEEITAGQKRVMDCVDCHNRPSHIYNSPDHAIDMAMASGMLATSLPDMKRVAVEAMLGEYETEGQALDSIEARILAYYRENHESLAAGRAGDLDRAVTAVQTEFARNIFPEMKVRWSVYPDNIGHQEWPGCMRCHGGKHTSASGETISHDCRSCHTIRAQGSGDRRQVASTEEGLEFVHPVDIDEAWREMGCFECHSGQQP